MLLSGANGLAAFAATLYLYRFRCVKNGLYRVMRTLFLFICENKGADQLRGKVTTQLIRLFRAFLSTIPLIPKSEI